MHRTIKLIYLLILLAMLGACTGHSGAGDEDDADIKATQTPVTVTHLTFGPAVEMITLNATSAFLNKNAVKSSVNGYILKSSVSPGEWVSQNEVLFVLKTREAEAIGSAAGRLDSTLGFSGTITIKAPQGGFISDLSHQSGDYVQDGEPLCTIADRNSFVFLLDVPADLTRLVTLQSLCNVLLPDGQQVAGRIISMLPSMDAASQTQRFEIKPLTILQLPENLVAKVHLVEKESKKAMILPKAAVLSDEGETQFWVMQLINDTMAVKVPVTTGILMADSIEILSPQLGQNDRFLLTGNYGLDDTAQVKVENNQ